MIEKDNIQELFSKAFENHASAVKPELWTGVQAKMAAAGMVGGTAVVKGVSTLTKWIIGTAAVTTIGVTSYLVLNNNDQPEKPVDTITTATSSVNPTTENDNPNSIVLDQKGNNTVATNNGATNNTDENILVQQSEEYFDFNQIESSPVNEVYTSNSFPLPDSKKYVQQNNGGATQQTASGVTNTEPTNGSEGVNKTPVDVKATTPRDTETNRVDGSASSANVKQAKIEVPNVFSPNFDTKNDYFELISEENVSKVEITILDPNGKKVFVSDDKNFKWNGNNMSDEPCAQGIYSYQLVYFDLNGKANLKGDYIYLQR